VDRPLSAWLLVCVRDGRRIDESKQSDDPGGLMKLFVAGLSYRTTPVELRELLAVKQSELVTKSYRLKSHGELDEIVLLSTCNRVEIYGVARQLPHHVDSLFRLLGDGNHDFSGGAYIYQNLEAASHLFRVASGLDSLVLGETEISCQVKNAYETARAAHLTGPVLNRTFQKAFQTLKAIRTQTNIGRGATSIGSVAGELAGKIFGHSLGNQKVMVIGAGQMGQSCIRRLVKKGVGSILISNRSFQRATDLAREFGGRVLPFDRCLAAMAEVDIVVAATACPKMLLRRAELEELIPARRSRPLILIDLSVPRNIDPDVQEIDHVYLYNIDDFEAIVREHVRSRRKDMAMCQHMVGSHAASLMEKLKLADTGLNEAILQPRAGWRTEDAANLAGQALLRSISLASL
jgi:glutamyl-tRNA reductase